MIAVGRVWTLGLLILAGSSATAAMEWHRPISYRKREFGVLGSVIKGKKFTGNFAFVYLLSNSNSGPEPEVSMVLV